MFKSTLSPDLKRKFSYLPPKPVSDASVVHQSPTPPTSPPVAEIHDNGSLLARNEDPSDDLDSVKEEIAIEDDIEEKAPDPALHQKLDAILNKKFVGIYNKIRALEGKLDRIDRLIRSGVQQEDVYWEFNNPRDLKPLNRYYSMIDKLYAMNMDAVKFNRGILREKAPPRNTRSGESW